MTEVWDALPAWGQDLLFLLLLLSPALLIGLVTTRGFRTVRLARAMMARHPSINLLFVLVIALAVGLGVAVVAQERALRQGGAVAADPFDVLVTAPGSPLDMTMAVVFLQPTDAPLLGPEDLRALQADRAIAMLAPIGFGDSWRGAAVVGTTAEFVARISGESLAEGRMFERIGEAVVGASSPAEIGDQLDVAHGHGHFAERDAHAGVELMVVGRMRTSGGPWDDAVVTPIEHLWATHGMALGHAPPKDGEAMKIGPPFDPEYFPGAPAFVASAERLAGAYRIRQGHRNEDRLAFFPGEVLSELYRLLGDARAVMSAMTTASQALVAAAALAGLLALSQLFRRRFALLRALGAPRRFVMAAIWTHAALLGAVGAALGLALGWLGASVVSAWLAHRSGMTLSASIGWTEIHFVGGFVSIVSMLALIPALSAYRTPIVEGLRGG